MRNLDIGLYPKHLQHTIHFIHYKHSVRFIIYRQQYSDCYNDLYSRELGIDLLKTLSDPDLLLAKLCARCSASMAEINHLHHLVGTPFNTKQEKLWPLLRSSM